MDETIDKKSENSENPINYGSLPPPAPVEQRQSFKWKVGYSALAQLSFFILSIVIMILAIVAYTNLNDKGDAILDFQNNWKLSPIVDIKTSTSACPEGYGSLLQSRWPGTDTGCDCTHRLISLFGSNKVYRGICHDGNGRGDGCVTVWSKSSKPLEFLGDYRICGKREGPAYYKLPMPEMSGTTVKCPDDYKVCGTGDHENSI